MTSATINCVLKLDKFQFEIQQCIRVNCNSILRVIKWKQEFYFKYWQSQTRLSGVIIKEIQTCGYFIVLSVIISCSKITLLKQISFKLWQQLLCYSGGQVPAGTISAALARAPVGPASNLTTAPSLGPASTYAPAPAPLSPGNLSPQPGTLGPLPFHVSRNLILSSVMVLVGSPTVKKCVVIFLSIYWTQKNKLYYRCNSVQVIKVPYCLYLGKNTSPIGAWFMRYLQ